MMMPLICSCRNNNQPNAIYPLGTFPRRTCKDCGGTSICEHNRRRSQCKDCEGASICECEHNRIRRHCRDCGGKGMYAHSRVGSNCKECKQHRRTAASRDAAGRCPDAAHPLLHRRA